jgi:hypothetical protein
MEAVERYGALRGGVMAVWRVLRCHPFVKGGLDSVVKDPKPRAHSQDMPSGARLDSRGRPSLRELGRPRAAIPTLKITS